MPLYVHPAEARRRFREFAEGEITYANLAEGALLAAMEEDPSMDPAASLETLEKLADRVRRRTAPGDPPIFLLGHLQAVLFDEEGFTGNREHYYDIRNTLLHHVLESKRGLPISLSVIFLDVAQRIGLDAAGVGLPGHYLVKVSFELNEVFVDPFEGGATRTVADLREFVQTWARTTLEPHHLRRWGARETLIRVLTNMQNFYTRAGEPKRAAAARERIHILSSNLQN